MSATDTSIFGEQRALYVAETMVQALRTIASGKADYGRTIETMEEYEQIAKDALRKVGCFND